jgi:uncharacterized lipoprotein YajG
MKANFVTAAASLLLLAGCARHYNITLTNNHVITTSSKPKVNKSGDAVVFKDRSGKVASLPMGSIKQIEPVSHKPTPDSILKPSQ